MEKDLEMVSFKEDNQGFFADILVDKIRQTGLDLTEKNNFKTKTILGQITDRLSRENIIKFGCMTGEEAVPTEKSDGNVVISVVNKQQVSQRLRTLKEKERSKIQYIHISTVQVLIKSTFKKGIDTPMTLTLLDNRIRNLEEATITKGSCYLGAGKIKFDVNLQIALSLEDIDLGRSIILKYVFHRQDLFKKGNHPFSITYRINYALTNSHHSITFKNKDKIEINDLFKTVISLEQPQSNVFIKIGQPSRQMVIEESILDNLKNDKPISIQGKNEFEKITQAIKNIDNRL